MSGYGGIDQVPAYEVRVTPRISLDGTVVAKGPAVALGDPVEVQLAVAGPSGTDRFNSVVTAGGFYSLVLDTGHNALQAASAHAGRYGGTLSELRTVATGDSPAKADPDALLGELMCTAGLVYFAQLDATYQMLSGPWRVAETPVLSEVTVGTSIAADSLLGMVSGVRPLE